MATKEEIREDFMKRWFAIAISVGFATALASMPWLKDEVPFDWTQGQQLIRLAVAMLATLLSWEGYLLSIQSKPLTEGWRFAIDVFLVLLYLLLLLTSKFSFLWLWLHASAFIFYCIWDWLSIRGHRLAYVIAPPIDGAPLPSVWDVYRGSLADDPNIYRGPAITLMWPIYFWSLPISYEYSLLPSFKGTPAATILYGLFVLIGLYGYRLDKGQRFNFPARLLALSVSALVIFNANWFLGAGCKFVANLCQI